LERAGRPAIPAGGGSRRSWANATGESFADVAMQRERPQKDDSEAESDWRNVGLMPLAAPEEIKAFAVRSGFPRHRLTISTNATRRTTLSGHRTSSNLARIGQITTHIRSLGEQVETNVIDRKEKAELSAERAQEGASRLARAAPLKRKFTIRNGAESNNTVGYGPCIPCRPHSDRLVEDHCAVGPELLRSIQEVGFVRQLPHFRMQRSFV
jgi:hypothetical protein